jgi:hypothetical protein
MPLGALRPAPRRQRTERLEARADVKVTRASGSMLMVLGASGVVGLGDVLDWRYFAEAFRSSVLKATESFGAFAVGSCAGGLVLVLFSADTDLRADEISGIAKESVVCFGAGYNLFPLSVDMMARFW